MAAEWFYLDSFCPHRSEGGWWGRDEMVGCAEPGWAAEGVRAEGLVAAGVAASRVAVLHPAFSTAQALVCV